MGLGALHESQQRICATMLVDYFYKFSRLGECVLLSGAGNWIVLEWIPQWR